MRRKPNLKILLLLFAVFVCLTSFVFEANAQQRRRSTRRPTTRKPAATTTPPVSNLEIKDGARKVSDQIKNVSRFVYILGGIAGNIEAIDADIRSRRITRQTTIDQNAKDKQAVLQSIRNLQAGLSALEEEFRTKPALRIYAVWTDGVSALAEEAETQAAGGQMTESGKVLLQVIGKLSDALAALP